MKLSLEGYKKIGEGSDSEVFWKPGTIDALKVYNLGIPQIIIQEYSRIQSKLSRSLEKIDVELPQGLDIRYKGDTVHRLILGVLDLDDTKVQFGPVENFFGERAYAEVEYVHGATLNHLNAEDPLIHQIANVFKSAGLKIGASVGTFFIDPVNVKVLGFKKKTLDLVVTDIAANMTVSMVGYN